MSYILDALNKSEQERRGQQTPDLQTVHRSPPPKTERKFPTVWVIAGFALLNVAGLGYWLFTQQTTAPVATAIPAQTTPQTAATVAAVPAQTNTMATTPDQTSGGQPQTEQPVEVISSRDNRVTSIATDQGTLITPDTAFKPEPDSNPVLDPVRITELPVNVQRQIPDLVFSSHLFSDEPSFRMVNINGKMIREGDMVANNLKLLEISEEGVILGFRHYVFEVSVLRDWSFN